MTTCKEDIISLVKRKKELSLIDDSIVKDIIEKETKRNNLDIASLKKKEIKLLIKKARAELRGYVGQFQISDKKKNKMLKENDFNSLLKIHSSTKERMKFYPELKKIIIGLKTKSILDLGCGINPLMLASKDIEYYASDINNSDLNVVKKFFEKNSINGKVFVYDLRNFENNLPEADLCLLFKVLDTIETKGHKKAEKIINGLKCKYILVSFAIRALSGKKMNSPRRGWIEKMLKRLNLPYNKIKSENEIFYLIQKS